jgi:hypothetical protein
MCSVASVRGWRGWPTERRHALMPKPSTLAEEVDPLSLMAATCELATTPMQQRHERASAKAFQGRPLRSVPLLPRPAMIFCLRDTKAKESTRACVAITVAEYGMAARASCLVPARDRRIRFCENGQCAGIDSKPLLSMLDQLGGLLPPLQPLTAPNTLSSGS